MPLLTDQNLGVLANKDITVDDVLGNGAPDVVIEAATYAVVKLWDLHQPVIWVGFRPEDVRIEYMEGIMTSVWLSKKFFFKESK